MRKIKIFAFPSHNTVERTSGVDFARIIQPMKHLNGYKTKDYEFEVDIFKPTQSANWLEVAQKYDLIYFNYLNNDWGFAAMKVMAMNHGRKLIMDLDDAIWEIQPDNHAYDVYKKGSKSIRDFTIICQETDYITCTNQYLKHVICDRTGKHPTLVKSFPNYIDLDLYKYRPEFKDNHQIVLMHHGSTSHFIDLQEQEFAEGVDRIMKEYPNVILRTVGAMIPSYKKKWGGRYENAFGHQDVYQWIKTKFPGFMEDADIMVTPLKVGVYTKGKSAIKFLENSSAGKPGVYQDIRQYQEVVDGNNGFLASTAEDWYDGIKTLIDDKVLRRKMGENAFETVKNNWQIKDHVKDYADYFVEILTQD